MFKKVLYPLVALAILSGCVNENTNDCPPTGAGITITMPTISDGKGGQEPAKVNTIDLYVFDSNGVLKEIVTVPKSQVDNGTVNLNLPDGHYTVVAWAGSGNDLDAGGFEGTAGGGTGAPAATPGKTTLDDFRERLKIKPVTDGRAGTVEPVVPNFDDIYESVTAIDVVNGTTQGAPDFRFTKVTDNIRLVLNGFGSDTDKFEYYILGKNSVLKPDGTPDPNSPEVRYGPVNASFTDGTATIDFKTMRLMLDGKPSPMMLYIKSQGGDLIVPINLSENIANQKDGGGNPLYPTQAAVDAAGVLTVTITESVTGITVGMPTINDGHGGQEQATVGAIDLYVFDKDTGLLKEIVSVPKDQVETGTADLHLPDGNYTVVAWAGSGDNLNTGGFEGTTGSGAGAPAATPGTTTLNDFREQLKTKPITDGRDGTVEPTSNNFDDLYWSETNIVMKDGQPTGQTTTEFIKMTAKFQIVLDGLDGADKFEYYILGKNSVLQPDGTPDPNSPEVRYNPYALVMDGDKATVDIKTMRLMLADTANPLMLYIKENGTNIVSPINLNEAIRNARDSSGNALYPTQESVDETDMFPITLNVSRDTTVKVTVGDFAPTPLTPNLDTVK